MDIVVDDKLANRVTELIIPMGDQLESARSNDNPSIKNAVDKSPDLIHETIYKSPILGRHFKLADLSKAFDPDPPILDDSLPYIPVYTHLITHDLVQIERPKTPPILNTLRSRKALRSQIYLESIEDPSILNMECQDESKDCSPRQATFRKNKQTPLPDV